MCIRDRCCVSGQYVRRSLAAAGAGNSNEKFLPASAPAKGKGGGKLRMIQNGGLAAGGKKIFFKLLRLGKLDKLFTHQTVSYTHLP